MFVSHDILFIKYVPARDPIMVLRRYDMGHIHCFLGLFQETDLRIVPNLVFRSGETLMMQPQKMTFVELNVQPNLI